MVLRQCRCAKYIYDGGSAKANGNDEPHSVDLLYRAVK